jgi:hypothetical protein
MWQWMTTEKWWKEATPILDRPWELKDVSNFWTNVQKCSSIFKYPIRFQIENGCKILFWEDNWIEQPLKHMYPTLYQMSMQKKHTVQEVNYMGRWQLTFEGSLSNQDQQQLQELR